jgi:hypothetical protein
MASKTVLKSLEVWEGDEVPDIWRPFFYEPILSSHVDDMTPRRRGVRYWYYERSLDGAQ